MCWHLFWCWWVRVRWLRIAFAYFVAWAELSNVEIGTHSLRYLATCLEVLVRSTTGAFQVLGFNSGCWFWSSNASLPPRLSPTARLMLRFSLRAFSAVWNLDVVVKSARDTKGKKLSTFWAILLAALAVCGAALKPIDTVLNEPSIAHGGVSVFKRQ